jgi:hypothetical protein
VVVVTIVGVELAGRLSCVCVQDSPEETLDPSDQSMVAHRVISLLRHRLGGLVTADVYRLLAWIAPGEILDPIPDRAMAVYGVVLPPGGIVYGADVSWRVLRWSGVFLSC